jgi:hypothetical protein
LSVPVANRRPPAFVLALVLPVLRTDLQQGLLRDPGKVGVHGRDERLEGSGKRFFGALRLAKIDVVHDADFLDDVLVRSVPVVDGDETLARLNGAGDLLATGGKGAVRKRLHGVRADDKEKIMRAVDAAEGRRIPGFRGLDVPLVEPYRLARGFERCTQPDRKGPVYTGIGEKGIEHRIRAARELAG